MATTTIHCPRCDSDDVYRHGLSPTKRERFRCQNCRRVFLLAYSYGREVPQDKHLAGKIFTQRIERNNLTLRTRLKRLARKTICFSHSFEVHEKVIGAFIEQFMFY